MLPRATAVLLLALLAGCGGSDPDEDPEPIRASALVVYSSLPRSGGSAELGDAVAAGVPAHPIEVVSAMLPAASYPPAGRRILRRLRADNAARAPVEALYSITGGRWRYRGPAPGSGPQP